ncbi:MAG: GNAT family N-acetyltransferase, partial [Candidatus Nitrosocosmicus sp.]
MKIRKAKDTDKNEVVNFCKNTFEWGDYIDKVWDIWLKDTSGLLLVAETYDNTKQSPYPIALAHISECPDNILWIEGVRVNRKYRHMGIASSLITHITDIGLKNGFKEFNAIVSKTNTPSQRMLVKNGFNKRFEVKYYNMEIEKWNSSSDFSIQKDNEIKIKIASCSDIQSLIEFIGKFIISKQSNVWYFNCWKFYKLYNTFDNLISLIRKSKLLLFVDEMDNIKGISIINIINELESNLYKKTIVQICYLDCSCETDISKVIDVLIDTYSNISAIRNIQFYISNYININNNKYIKRLSYFEEFYLYS